MPTVAATTRARSASSRPSGGIREAPYHTCSDHGAYRHGGHARENADAGAFAAGPCHNSFAPHLYTRAIRPTHAHTHVRYAPRHTPQSTPTMPSGTFSLLLQLPSHSDFHHRHLKSYRIIDGLWQLNRLRRAADPRQWQCERHTHTPPHDTRTHTLTLALYTRATRTWAEPPLLRYCQDCSGPRSYGHGQAWSTSQAGAGAWPLRHHRRRAPPPSAVLEHVRVGLQLGPPAATRQHMPRQGLSRPPCPPVPCSPCTVSLRRGPSASTPGPRRRAARLRSRGSSPGASELQQPERS